MKIALIGATGFVGSQVLAELVARGHSVVALSTNPAKIPASERVTPVEADAYDAASVAKAIEGADALISAFNPGWDKPDIQALTVTATHAILDGATTAGVTRVLLVGGAGSLYVAPGLQAVDTPDFPAAWKEGALGARTALEIVKASDLDWTFVSPAFFLEPGERTGTFRLGGDEPVFDAAGRSAISVQDLAVAIVDAIEQGLSVRKRFTLGY